MRGDASLSAYTYLPFAYLLALSSAYGSAYHGKYEWVSPPYVLLTFSLVNAFVWVHYDTRALVREPLHAQAWRTVTAAFFGILLSDAHAAVFRDVHPRAGNENALAAAYLAGVWFAAFALRRDDAVLCVHLLFLYLPLRREWEAHLYLYVLYVAAAAFAHRARVAAAAESSRAGDCGALRPVLRVYAFLRVPGLWVLLGPPQMLFEYWRMQREEAAAFRRVRQMIAEEIELVQRQRPPV